MPLENRIVTLQSEIIQLQRTLEMRRSQTAVVDLQAHQLEAHRNDLCETLQRATEKQRVLEHLKAELDSSIQQRSRLTAEVKLQEDELCLLRQQEAVVAARRSHSLAEAHALMSELEAFCREQAALEEQCAPLDALNSLIRLQRETEVAVDGALQRYYEAEKKLQESTTAMVALHSNTFRDARSTSAEKLRQLAELEESWQREEQGLMKDLKLAQIQSKEAEHHMKRGTGQVLKDVLRPFQKKQNMAVVSREASVGGKSQEDISYRRELTVRCSKLESIVASQSLERDRAAVAALVERKQMQVKISKPLL